MEKLQQLSVSRTEPYDQVTKAKILLAYHEGEHKSSIARRIGVRRPTVDLCINKALCAGVQVSIRDLKRSGRPNIITADDKAWRHGTVSLMASLDLHDGHVHALVRDRHRSREFIEFLEEIDHYYLCDWKIKVLLDNHSAHVSKETLKWLAGRRLRERLSQP